MPISRSAKKSLRKSIKNRKVNLLLRKKVKSVIKKYLNKPTEGGLKEVFSVLDTAKKSGIYHKNKVARLKSTYSKKLIKKETKVEKKTVAKKKSAKKVK